MIVLILIYIYIERERVKESHAIVSVCTTQTLTKHIEKKLDENYTRIQRAILNKSWKQYSTKQQLYSHLPPISKAIQVRWTRHMRHCWRGKDKIISNILIWISFNGHACVSWPARTYLQQLCVDTGCHQEDLPGAMDDRGKWRESGKSVLARWLDDDDDDDRERANVDWLILQHVELFKN